MTLHIVNRLPHPDQEDVQLARPIRFGLREDTSYVALSSVQANAAYGRAVWLDDEDLPEDLFDPGLLPVRVEYLGFDDTIGDPTHLNPPLVPAVQGASPARYIEFLRPVDGGHDRDSFYYTSYELLPGRLAMVDFRVDLPVFHTPNTAPVAPVPYLPTEMDFTGFVAGTVYGPTRQALFVFFLHDGIQGLIRIAGPAIGGVRSPDVTLATVPWVPGTPYSLKFVWSPDRGQVQVLADNTGDWTDAQDELLAEINMEDINELLPGIVFGRQRYYEGVESCTAVVGLDGYLQNDEAKVYLFGPQSAGADLIKDGSPTGGVSVYSTGDSALLLDVGNLPDEQDSPWFRPDPGIYPPFPDSYTFGTTEVDEDALKLSKEGEVFNNYFRHEPSLASLLDAYGMVELQAKIDTTSRYAVGADGVGARLDFLDASLQLGVLADANVGLFAGGNPANSLDYHVDTANPVDLEDYHLLRLLMNKDRHLVELYIDNEDTPRVSVPQLLANFATPVLGWPPVVMFGFSHDFDVTSDFYVQHLQYSLHMEAYEAIDGLLATAAPTPWLTHQHPGTATVSITADNRLLIDDPTYSLAASGYFAHHRPFPAAAIIPYWGADFRMRITEWRTPEGKVNSASSWGGAGIALFDGTRWLYLTFVSSRGEKFLVVPGEDIDGDIEDAVAQNSAGRAISAAVDWSMEHDYRVAKEGTKVLVYVDDMVTPVLELDSPQLPLTSLFGWAGVASSFFGSIAPAVASKSEWRYFRVFSSRGYDFALDQGDVYTEELKDAIYDGFGNVTLEAESV